ncbi:alpha/beta hydrolase [Hymenobacter edaphi]|uniref:Alpha/beta hydrolase n=1 Tax=Hymenobacter edaphi TaxID=2211146 RepID=A0A328BM23_9BACT|nr:alpha/beta hydrolase [Hymenobacter edaphi]RAK68017.1 hypothetical protein DLM85_08215 [Hymenobacter edaphi]
MGQISGGVLLIPGYGTELRRPLQHGPLSAHAGFGAARPLLATGRAAAFRWGVTAQAAALAGHLNPRTHWRLYALERRQTTRTATLRALHEQCRAQQPEVILCHSLGCQLWLHYAAAYALEPSVRRVVFVQADVAAGFVPGSVSVQARLVAGELSWLNLWCSWDQALLASAALHGRWPAGLTGAGHPLVQNHFFPLYRRWNLHTSSINDAALLRFLT